MSDFLEGEADESSGDEFGETSNRNPISDDDDDVDEDEDEDAVEEVLAQEADDEGNIEGLIDDDVVDDGEEAGSGEESSANSDSDAEEEIGSKAHKKKRKHDHALEDDDLDLIEENLGVKLKRKKFSRIKQDSSDESDSDGGEGQDRDAVANQLFTEGDIDQESVVRPEPVVPTIDEEEDELSEDSDVDDFIVDDNGEPISKPSGHKKRKGDAVLQNMQEIFGGDFDYEEFDKYGDQYDEEMEEDDYYDGLEGDDIEEIRQRKKKDKSRKKKSIFDVYEPDTLERGFFTDMDAEIRSTDVPERFQLRTIPVRPADDAEIEVEAEWIYKHCFVETSISKQENYDDIGSTSSLNRKPQSAVGKIQDALKFIRNQQFEMPFIAFYRKEYIEPELNIHDLNKIYHWDEKWTQLNTRKANLTRLLQKMQTYQYEQISADPDKPLGDNVRALSDTDIEKIQSVMTMEELKDVYNHFLLHYGKDIPKMQNALRNQRRKERSEQLDDDETAQSTDLKQASRRDMYTVCLNAGLGGVANKFGLTPEQFGENLRDNYQRHETEQYPVEPKDLANDFICSQFNTPERVLEGARYMVAMQLARESLVRQCVRQMFRERAKIKTSLTKKGRKEIDESHPCYPYKYLKNKPIRDLSGPQFLHLHTAEADGYITMEISIDMHEPGMVGGNTYYDEIKPLYYRDEFSHLVQEWNAQRSMVLKLMLEKILYKEMTKETKELLLKEAKDGIVDRCRLQMRKWLSVAPFHVEEREDEEEPTKGATVMALSYSENRDTAIFAALLDGDGEVQDFIRLPSMRFRKTSWNEDDRKRKEKDIENLKEFISKRKPHVVMIGVEDRFALMLQDDIKELLRELEQEGSIAPTSVEIMDNQLAATYATTKKAESDFPDYPIELRQAVSLARRVQDPLLEFAQLCTQDEDLLCLKIHPLQDLVEKDDLLTALMEEFVYRSCEVGVDVNQAIMHAHTSNVLQFVCGLGPRKAANLLKVLKQKNGRLENRSNLVTVCKMGPKIFINCAGFIKIDTNSMGDSTDAYIEVLDGLRVHPETYEWARKMAVDALEYDETAEDANPSSALEEILESPERLKDLDLDAFADELERQGYGNKGITLYDIRNELDCRYKDYRTPYRPPSAEEKFSLVTKETLDTFREGKLIVCRVIGIAHRRPRAEQLDQAEPHKDESTGLWSCSFCNMSGFAELSEVWSHLDSGECLGKAVGVRTRLDNGLMGFIATDKLSDSKVTNPEERVKVGMVIHCRLMKVDIEKLTVDLTSRSSDLKNEEIYWGQLLDLYYDTSAEANDKKEGGKDDKNKNRTTYIKRVIAHPSFHNVDFKTAEKMLLEMDQGDVIIRPSSKGSEHLTATWNVGEGVCSHIDIREEEKENAFSLGKNLWIGNEEFEDLDEIIARFIQPMAANANDVISHKNYKDTGGGRKDVAEESLKKAKKAAPSRIPYIVSISKQLPGRILLSYMPRIKPKHEYVTLLPEGFRYRGQVFSNLNQLFKWFKEHFRDPIPAHLMPGNRQTSHTPRTPAATPHDGRIRQPPMTPKTGPYATPHTPYGQQPINTPYTPMAIVTPNQAYTPNVAMVTPSYQTQGYAPPPQRSWGGPPTAMPPKRNQTPSGHKSRDHRDRDRGRRDHDWGKAAEEWMSKKGSKPNTPRGPRTPIGSYKGTPRTPQHRTPRTPRGDRTPA